MARWFRFYDEALDDPKVQRLPPHLFKTWVNLLCLASKDGGKLPSNDDIAFKLRISVHDAAQQVEDLILAGLIDIDGKNARSPHNWEVRQYSSDSSAERTRKYREKKKTACDVTGDVTVTVQSRADTEADTDTEAEQKQTSARQSEVSNLILGKVSRSVSDRLLRRAVGFGLPVEAFKARATSREVEKPNGLFKKLCIDELAKRLPRATRTQIEAAMDPANDAAYAALQTMMVS